MEILDENVSINGSNCSNVIVEPTKETAKVIAETTEDISDDFLNEFSDEPLEVDPEKAVSRLKGFVNFLKSDTFKNKINSAAYKKGIPPRKLAHGFISKTIGTLGDVLGIGIETIRMTLNGLLDLLHSILKSGLNIIMNAVQGLARMITFNQSAA